jgi:hypothetical protein
MMCGDLHRPLLLLLNRQFSEAFGIQSGCSKLRLQLPVLGIPLAAKLCKLRLQLLVFVGCCVNAAYALRTPLLINTQCSYMC